MVRASERNDISDALRNHDKGDFTKEVSSCQSVDFSSIHTHTHVPLVDKVHAVANFTCAHDVLARRNAHQDQVVHYLLQAFRAHICDERQASDEQKGAVQKFSKVSALVYTYCESTMYRRFHPSEYAPVKSGRRRMSKKARCELCSFFREMPSNLAILGGNSHKSVPKCIYVTIHSH
jgi:hypothetical protein